MKTTKYSRLSLSTVGGLLAVIVLSVATSAQQAQLQDQTQEHVGLPSDWSHRHLIFSNRGTYQQMLTPAVSEERRNNWTQLQDDPRVILQQHKDKALHTVENQEVAQAREALDQSRTFAQDRLSQQVALTQLNEVQQQVAETRNGPTNNKKQKQPDTLAQDWNTTISAVKTGSFPAKYTFDINATPSCSNDYVVFGIDQAGSSTQASLVGFNNLYSSNLASPGLCGSDPTVAFAYNTGGGKVPTAQALSLNGTKIAFVENAAASVFHVLTIGTTGNNGAAYNAPITPGAAVSTTVSSTSVTTNIATTALTNVAASVTVTTNTGSARFVANDYVQIDSEIMLVTATGASALTITRAQLGTTAAPHSVGAAVNLLGVVSASTIIRVAATTGFVANDIVLIDSEKIQLSTSGNITTCGTGLLVPCFKAVTRGAQSTTAASHSSGASVATANNNAVDVRITLNGNAAVTLSAPFIDYTNDRAYIGDDVGKVHQITGVFSGTPAETIGGGWPATAGGGANILTPPVVFGGNVYVGGSDAKVYCLSATSGAACATASITVGTIALQDAPTIDGSTNKLFIAGMNALVSPVLVQTSTSFTGTVTAVMGQTGTGTAISHLGAFDNAYLTNPFNGSSSAGSMYFCGVQTNAAVKKVQTLYRIGFNSTGTMNGTKTGDALELSSDTGECQGLTSIYNPNADGGAKDFLFVPISNKALACGATGTGHGCVWVFDVTSGFPTVATAFYGIGGGEGPSGVVVDNVSVSESSVTTSITGNGTASTLGGAPTATTTVSGNLGGAITLSTTALVGAGTGSCVSPGSACVIVLTGGTNPGNRFAVGEYVVIDSEQMLISAVANTQITVSRAQAGTSFAGHANGAGVAIVINSLASIITVGATTGFVAGDFVQIDSEIIQIGTISTCASTSPVPCFRTVTRGAQGTSAASHILTATVTNLTTTAAATTINVASTAGFVAGDYIKIDSEFIQIGAVATCAAPVASTPCFTGVTRAALGTSAATHTGQITGVGTSTAVTDFTVSAAAGSVNVLSSTGFAIGDYIQIDSEAMKITGTAAGQLTVTRGQLGTTAVAHPAAAAGFTVQNLSAAPQTSSVYFINFHDSLAVKATQSKLQ